VQCNILGIGTFGLDRPQRHWQRRGMVTGSFRLSLWLLVGFVGSDVARDACTHFNQRDLQYLLCIAVPLFADVGTQTILCSLFICKRSIFQIFQGQAIENRTWGIWLSAYKLRWVTIARLQRLVYWWWRCYLYTSSSWGI